MPKRNPCELFGVKAAAAYLGVGEHWVRRLANEWRESGGRKGLEYFQETPPAQNEDGTWTSGSSLVFTRQWLDSYAARRQVGSGPGRGRPRKNAAESSR